MHIVNGTKVQSTAMPEVMIGQDLFKRWISWRQYLKFKRNIPDVNFEKAIRSPAFYYEQEKRQQ